MVDIYQVQLRNGTAAQVDTFTGASGELTYDTDTGQVRIHDGSTVGGFKLVYRDSSNPSNIASIMFERAPYSGGASSAGSIVFGAMANGTTGIPTERMRITEGGNIGIGTSSPNVYGAGFVNLQINSTTGGIIQATYGGTTAIAEILTTSGEGRFGTRTNHPMILKTNNTERMRLDSSGNVGIGTSSPQEKVHAYEASGFNDPSAYQFLAQNFSGFSMCRYWSYRKLYSNCWSSGWFRSFNRSISQRNNRNNSGEWCLYKCSW
jgi:hypothetical protein